MPEDQQLISVEPPLAASVISSPGIMRPMLRLAVPALCEQLLNMLVGFSDSLLTGWYFDKVHLAAINLMVYAIWMLTSMFVLVGIGATAMTARFSGAGDRDTAARVTNQAFVVGAVLAAAFTAAGIVFSHRLVLLLQLEGPAAALATSYLHILFPVLPAIMCSQVGIACLRGAGDMVTGMVVMAIVNAANVALSWGLVHGWGPLPALGWNGLAVGTAAGHVIGGLLIVALLARGRMGLRLRLALLRPDADLIRRLLRIGVPGGLDVMLIISLQFWFVAIINRLGDLAAAAHGVAIRIESVAYLPGFAFQLAAATLAGQYLGARDYRNATRSVLLTCLVGGSVMVVAGVVCFVGAGPLARVFVPEQQDVATLAASLLRIVAVCMPTFALSFILKGALRGAGDTRVPLLFTLFGFLGVRIPLAYWLADVAGLGVRGAWYAMVIDVVVRCVLITVRFFHGGWKRIDV